jgi:hypothetical protein
MVAPLQHSEKLQGRVIARGDKKAAALATRHQSTPFKDWAKSHRSELRQLHSRASTPFATVNTGVALAVFGTLEEQLEELFAAKLSPGKAAFAFARTPDAHTQQHFAPELVMAYNIMLASIVRQLRRPNADEVLLMDKAVWFVAALAQVHIMRTASSGLKGLLLGDMGLDEDVLRYDTSLCTFATS